jgi:hypothetical protein
MFIIGWARGCKKIMLGLRWIKDLPMLQEKEHAAQDQLVGERGNDIRMDM